jgi:hypothetical protein
MSLKENLEREIYLLEHAPRILSMDVDGIYINKSGLYPDEVESLQNIAWQKDKLQTPKLKAKSYGDWQFDIGMIHTKHFNNREQLDDMFVDKSERIVTDCCTNVDRISIRQAIKLFKIRFSCNMDWYLQNQHAIEEDLNRQILPLTQIDEYSMKKLEEELFYNQMCKLFGETEDDQNKPHDDDTIYEKSFILKDFHMLYEYQNDMLATARRGNYYLLFTFVY